MKTTISYILVVLATCALAQVKLDVEPRTLSGIPGELLLLELTIESERADSAVLRVPYSSNLVVRAVEKNLVTKSRTGGFVQKRELLLQGVEAGKTVMTNLVVEINGNLHLFPSVTVEVREVAPAAPPERVVKEAP